VSRRPQNCAFCSAATLPDMRVLISNLVHRELASSQVLRWI